MAVEWTVEEEVDMVEDVEEAAVVVAASVEDLEVEEEVEEEETWEGKKNFGIFFYCRNLFAQFNFSHFSYVLL